MNQPDRSTPESEETRPTDAEGSCVFCEIIAGRAPGIMPTRWDDAVVIEPLSPVTEGHVLIVPRQHVQDAAENQHVTAATMRRVAGYLKTGPYPDVQPIGPCNVITSCGAEATQTVMHLHVHVVPRRADDGLTLPWTEPAAALRQPREGAGGEGYWHERWQECDLDREIAINRCASVNTERNKVLAEMADMALRFGEVQARTARAETKLAVADTEIDHLRHYAATTEAALAAAEEKLRGRYVAAMEAASGSVTWSTRIERC